MYFDCVYLNRQINRYISVVCVCGHSDCICVCVFYEVVWPVLGL